MSRDKKATYEQSDIYPQANLPHCLLSSRKSVRSEGDGLPDAHGAEDHHSGHPEGENKFDF